MIFLSRTFCAVKMNGSRLWLAAAALQTLLLAASCGQHRRIMATHATMPVSKGGWRPVISSGGLVYGSFGTAPLHAPQYKIPVPVLDAYQSSARPLASRDAAKLTSIAQSYRPTTHRTVQTSQQSQMHQPINSYHNPFAIQNNGLFQNGGLNIQNGLNYYKHTNFPMDSVVIRNPHNPYAARPVFPKYPQNKFKQQQLQNNGFQQLTSIQPIQFAQYQTNKPLDIFGKPVESYVRPTENKKQQSGGTEIYKQEVYKLPDSDTASQSVSHQVKTAQQQNLGIQHNLGQQNLGVQQNLGLQNQIYNPYGQYGNMPWQDAALPPNILGSYGNVGLQSIKGGHHLFQFPSTKPTFFSQAPSKQTIFNSFNYSPNYKTTPLVFSSTTPRLPTTPNQFQFSSTYNDYKITPVPITKASTPPKIDPNAGAKDSFKPSPQDPFSKYNSNDYNKIIATTFNPIHSTANNIYEYSFQAQNVGQKYHDQKNINYNFDKKQVIHDSVPAGGNQQLTKQYANPPSRPELHGTIRPTYEVTEPTDSDVITHSSPAPWSLTSQPYDNPKSTEEAPQKQEYTDYGLQNPTPLPALPEEYAIVTEAEKGYDNSLSYDRQVETQSRRPLGDDFEPIGKHKLNDYYTYKVSTPSYDDIHVPRRTKKPTTESSKLSTQETTTASTVASDKPVDALPTLPPNKHFKRPSTPEPSIVEKDRIRKRTKVRRRRPTLAQLNRNKEETSTRAQQSQPTEAPATDADEIHTIKPRVRPVKLQSASTTTVRISSDLTTSALPTITPTAPTLKKKKLAHRRLSTTTPADRYETTTTPNFKIYEANKESQIMKIANRQQYKSTLSPYETPDYTHKQDEKDTPTSDVSVSLNDGLKTTAGTDLDLEFAFHKDVKPIEAKLEPVTHHYRETTTDTDVSNEITTFAPRIENSSSIGRIPRPRLRNKYNRPKFSVKEYKSRLGSTTTTEKPVENTPKVRFPQRRVPYTESDSETTTERKKFTPKDARYKLNTETTESDKDYYVRPNIRQRQTTVEVETTTKVSARIRNGNRRTKPIDETTETLPTTGHIKRPLRKKIVDSEIGESVQDISVTETTIYNPKDITSERTRSESAIMKIADKKHHDPMEHLFEHSKRVSDLTLAASKDYNKPGMFKSVSNNSRRIPNYFTIATDDPILPIEAFFPQLNQKKET